MLAALDLARHFDFVLCSALERVEKPSPAIFDRALARAGVAPDEALHVGDHPRKDVDAARARGLHAIRIDHGARTSGPDHVKSFAELAARLRGLVETARDD